MKSTTHTELINLGCKERQTMRDLSSRSSTRSKSTPTPCCSKVGIKRGPWTPEEDEILASYVKKEGEGRWRTLPKRAGLLRCGKSCRLRWMNYLRPSVKRGRIAPDEEDLILRLHRLLGNRWSLIAGRIPGRTDNEIKNYWNSHLSKKLISQGIDPRTHKPLNPNPNSSETAGVDPIHNYNPSPFPLGENDRVYGTVATKNFAMDQFPKHVVDAAAKNWLNSDDLIMELQSGHGEENCIGNGNEDTFSSFVDSLMNENVFEYQQLQQLQQPNMLIGPSATASSSHAFDHGNNIWELADVAFSTAGLGETDDAFNIRPA